MPRTYLCLLFCKVAYKRAGEVSASLAECDKSVEFILHLRSQRFSASEIFGFEFSCNQGDLPMSTGLLNCFWFTRNESEENSFGKVKMTRTGNYQRKITHYWKSEKMTNCSWRNIILPTKKHFCTWKTFVSCDEYRCLSTHSVEMIWLHVMYYYPNLFKVEQVHTNILYENVGAQNCIISNNSSHTHFTFGNPWMWL